MSKTLFYHNAPNVTNSIMSQQVDVSIIVPTYNEAENLPVLVKKLDTVLRNRYRYEIIVVDDNSPDGTAEIAQELAKSYPVRVIVRPGRMGLASAIAEGMRHARGRYIVVMDADLQHPPEKVPELLEKLENGYDIVVGSRRVKGGKDLGLTGIRKIISLGANVLAWLLVPESRSVRDAMSGFFALRREYIISSTRLRGYKILLEILLNAIRQGARVCEVPIVFKRREKGSSKLTLKESLNYIRDIVYLSKGFLIKQVPLSILLSLSLIFANHGIYTVLSIAILFSILKYFVHEKSVNIVGSCISTLVPSLLYILINSIDIVKFFIVFIVDFVITSLFRRS